MLDNLKKSMVSISISILEHNDLIFSATSYNKPYLAMFWFNKNNHEFLSGKKLSQIRFRLRSASDPTHLRGRHSNSKACFSSNEQTDGC